jgi:hypothetical protein
VDFHGTKEEMAFPIIPSYDDDFLSSCLPELFRTAARARADRPRDFSH